MKRFFICLGVFALIMIACDVAAGFVGDKMVKTVTGGDTGRMNYIANKADEDVLVFGSSRAKHHYDPDILEDTLGLSVYNCAFDGNGIVCAYGYYKLIKERYYPKVLVYEITPAFDLKVNDNHKYLGHLRFFYDRAGVDSLFWDVDKTERYKMASKMYRYNSVYPQLIMNHLHPFKSYHKGYLPLDEEMKTDPKPVEKQADIKYDSLKLHYLERLIQDCEGNTQLIFAISPMYGNTEDAEFEPIKTMCEKYGIPLLNQSMDADFNSIRDYFKDRTHLNRTGATAYTKLIAQEIKNILTTDFAIR